MRPLAFALVLLLGAPAGALPLTDTGLPYIFSRFYTAGLEWYRPSLVGSSSTGLNKGATVQELTDQGFRLATGAEVTSFITSQLGSGPSYSPAAVLDLIYFLDYACCFFDPDRPAAGAGGAYEGGDPMLGTVSLSWSQRLYSPGGGYDPQPPVAQVEYRENRVARSATTGLFLVRAVPEPGTAALVAMGLAALATGRRPRP